MNSILDLPLELREPCRLLDLMHEAVFARDLEGRILFWNRAAERKYGWIREEVLGRNATELLKSQFPISWPEIEQKLAQAEFWDGHVVHTRRSGERLVVESRLSVIKDSAGAPLAVLEIDNNLLHRIEGEETWESFFHISLDLFCIGGFDGYFKELNGAWMDTLGYSKEELLSRPYIEFVHPDDVEKTKAEAHKITLGASTITFENRYRCKDGSYKLLLWKTVILCDHHTTYSTARDRTLHKKAEDTLAAHAARLEQSNRELQEFAHVASHDLQEPLRKIQAFGDRLQAKYSSALDDEGRDYIARMQNSAQRMRTLIEDLLTFSRVTSQAQPLVKVDLAEVIAEVISDFEECLRETGGRIEVGDLPLVKADPIQMQHLFLNLISNALKFHRENEPPIVRIFCDDENQNPNSSCLIVADNGIGFDEKYSDRIFQAFQRLHGRTEYEGTGIGLAICRKIVQRHGSNITVRSTPGEGSKFLFELALWKEETSRSASDKSEGDPK